MGIPSPSEWLKDVAISSGLPGGGLDTITNNLIPYAVPVLLFLLVFLSLLFLIIGGIRWITSGGDKEAMAKAKGTVTYAIVGLILGLATFIILGIVGQLFNVNLLGRQCMVNKADYTRLCLSVGPLTPDMQSWCSLVQNDCSY